MVPLHGLLCNAQFLAHNVGLNAEIGKLVPQSLGLYAQVFALLLSYFNLFVQHNGSFQRDVVFVLQLFDRSRLVAIPALKVVVVNLCVPQLHLQ